MDYYRNRNILITGAFGGFGLCFVSGLLARGANLILSDTSKAAQPFIDDRGKMPGAGTGREGRILSIIPADLSSPEGCSALYEEYKKLGVQADMIIHNAGIGFGAFSTCTRHIRQLAAIESFLW